MAVLIVLLTSWLAFRAAGALGVPALAAWSSSATSALALVIKAESIQELDELIQSFPIWPRMETTVTPLTSFEGRMVAVGPRVERLKAMLKTA